MKISLSRCAVSGLVLFASGCVLPDLTFDERGSQSTTRGPGGEGGGAPTDNLGGGSSGGDGTGGRSNSSTNGSGSGPGGETPTGGTASTGGTTGTGGTPATGGSTNTGGTTATGGSTNTGGTSATGGTTSTGGTGGGASLGFPVRVNRTTSGTQTNNSSSDAAITPDGRYVVFSTEASNLFANDNNGGEDIFLFDRTNQTLEHISVSSSEVPGAAASRKPAISADGRFVSFHSASSNLVSGDTNDTWDVFVRDRQAGTTARVSLTSAGGQATGPSLNATISEDGRFVAFESGAANLVAGDTNTKSDIFVHDRMTAATTRVSRSTAGIQSGGACFAPSLSADGRYVAFFADNDAANLVASDTNDADDVYVHDRTLGTTILASVNTDEVQGVYGSSDPRLSPDGRYLVFHSFADNLTPMDWNSRVDVFLRDLQGGTTERISVNSAEEASTPASGFFPDAPATISADGRYVLFESDAPDLVPGDTNAQSDIFLRDRTLGTTVRVSLTTAGGQATGRSSDASLATAGGFFVFRSTAGNLVSDDTNGEGDIFVGERP